MSINNVSCTLLGQSGLGVYDSVSTSTSIVPKYVLGDSDAYADGIVAGSGNVVTDGYGYASIFKFKIPTVPLAISTSINFVLPLVAWMEDITLNYAICTSDVNYAKYYGGYGDVSDSKQIVNGSISYSDNCELVNGRYQFILNCETESLRANTTYYLFVWAANSEDKYVVFTMKSSLIKITLSYICGAVYIDNGTSLQMHQIYIDNGTSWDIYVPYIDNGSEWEIYS